MKTMRKLFTAVLALVMTLLDWQLHPNTSHIHPYMYG